MSDILQKYLMRSPARSAEAPSRAKMGHYVSTMPLVLQVTTITSPPNLINSGSF